MSVVLETMARMSKLKDESALDSQGCGYLLRNRNIATKEMLKDTKAGSNDCRKDLGLGYLDTTEELKRGLDVDLFVDLTGPAVQRGDHDDVDGDPVGQLGAGPEEQTQPEQVQGQPDEVQPEVRESASVLRTIPRKKAIKERWTLKQ